MSSSLWSSRTLLVSLGPLPSQICPLGSLRVASGYPPGVIGPKIRVASRFIGHPAPPTLSRHHLVRMMATRMDRSHRSRRLPQWPLDQEHPNRQGRLGEKGHIWKGRVPDESGRYANLGPDNTRGVPGRYAKTMGAMNRDAMGAIYREGTETCPAPLSACPPRISPSSRVNSISTALSRAVSTSLSTVL